MVGPEVAPPRGLPKRKASIHAELAKLVKRHPGRPAAIAAQHVVLAATMTILGVPTVRIIGSLDLAAGQSGHVAPWQIITELVSSVPVTDSLADSTLQWKRHPFVQQEAERPELKDRKGVLGPSSSQGLGSFVHLTTDEFSAKLLSPLLRQKVAQLRAMTASVELQQLVTRPVHSLGFSEDLACVTCTSVASIPWSRAGAGDDDAISDCLQMLDEEHAVLGGAGAGEFDDLAAMLEGVMMDMEGEDHHDDAELQAEAAASSDEGSDKEDIEDRGLFVDLPNGRDAALADVGLTMSGTGVFRGQQRLGRLEHLLLGDGVLRTVCEAHSSCSFSITMRVDGPAKEIAAARWLLAGHSCTQKEHQAQVPGLQEAFGIRHRKR